MNTEMFRVPAGKNLDLNDNHPTDFTGDYTDKKDAVKDLEQNVERLRELQNVLYAEDKRSLLIIFQAMDAAGKDGAIEHVMSGVNPQGCHVVSFKQPSDEELSHDFLWRCAKNVPERGKIGIFNRSHYEEVLIVRVHRIDLAGTAPCRRRSRTIRTFGRNGLSRSAISNRHSSQTERTS